MTDQRPAVLLARAAARLADCDSPTAQARILLAHVMGTDQAGLWTLDRVAPADADRFDALVERRRAGERLQHLTGLAWFRTVSVRVGPGVFVPRPETELVAGWAIDRLSDLVAAGQRPVVVEAGTGSAAIAKAIATEVPETDVHACELDEGAYGFARDNLTGAGVELALGDLATAFGELRGAVDLVISNPPYIPLTAWESVTPEVRDHDPALALWSGEDGLDAMRALAAAAASWLRPGGWVVAEHAEVQEEAAPAVFVADGRFGRVRDHRDLNDRPRFVTARRRSGLAGLGE